MQAACIFTALTFGVSWLLWIASAAMLGWDMSQTNPLMVVSGPLYLLGVFAPAFVALALTAHADGRAGVTLLVRQTLSWAVGARWYVFALSYFAAIKIAVAIAHRLITGQWPLFTDTPWFLMVVAMAFSTPTQAGEEIGWRGYLLPRLSARVGLPAASLIVGVVWACWHLPFFLIAGTDKSGQSFLPYALDVTALSVVMAWLYWRTQGSLLLTMLMHAAVNNTNLVPAAVSTSTNPFGLRSSLAAWLTVALLWACALSFLIAMRGQRDLPPTAR